VGRRIGGWNSQARGDEALADVERCRKSLPSLSVRGPEFDRFVRKLHKGRRDAALIVIHGEP